MSKKILSLALVVVMLMSTFALTAFAASGPLSSVGVKVVTTATESTKAGDPITVQVFYTVPADADLSGYLHNLSNIVLSYTDAYELDSTGAGTTSAADAREYGASYADYLEPSKTVNNAPAFHTTISGKYTDNDKAHNWTNTVYVAQVVNNANGYNSTSGYPIDVDCEVFTLKFVAARDFTAADSIGVPEGSVTGGQTKMTYITTAGKNGQYAKSTDTITLSEAVAYPAPATVAEKVYHVKNQLRWANGAADATAAGNKVDLGIVCGFDIADIAIDFEENGSSKNVKEIGVVATINGETKNYTERFVYSAKEGTAYYFRAIIGGVPANYNADIQITPYVVVDGVEEPYYGKVVTISAEALANNVAKL